MKKFLKRLLCWLLGHRFEVREDFQGYKYVSRPPGESGPFGEGVIQWWEATRCARCGTLGRGRRLGRQVVGKPVVYMPYSPLFVTTPVERKP